MANGIEIEYLQPKSEFRIGSVKNIAVPSNNKDDLKNAYPREKKVESNADMLSQSFGAVPEIVPISTNIQANSQSEPVEITAIPSNSNSNLETTPVDLNMSAPVVNEIPKIEPIVNELPEINVPINEENNIIVPSKIEEIVSVNNPNDINNVLVPKNDVAVDNDFKVSDAPNIFDNPMPATGTDNTNVENNNIFNEVNEPKIENPLQSIEADKSALDLESLNDDIILAEIAILESDIKHYEGLAQNNKQKIELLKKQMNKKNSDINLENTASDLFNNNGALDEDKVLGRVPMPNLKSA